MALPQQTYSVLVVSARSKFHTSLRELLPEDRYTPLCYVSDVASARRCLLERPFDIVVISAPLPEGTKSQDSLAPLGTLAIIGATETAHTRLLFWVISAGTQDNRSPSSSS